jgi:hypothetical protein
MRWVLIALFAVCAAALPARAAGVGSVCGGARGTRCDAGLLCEKAPGRCGAVKGTCVRRRQSCTGDYRPVCGCNGRTYSNDCVRAYFSVSKQHDGACQPRGKGPSQ